MRLKALSLTERDPEDNEADDTLNAFQSLSFALTGEEREEECDEADELGTGLSSLVEKYGREEIMERIVKLTEADKD